MFQRVVGTEYIGQEFPVARNRSYGQYGRDDEARPE